MSNYGALANIDPNPIMQRLQRGESLRQIASDLGVSNVGLRAWLLREDREQYYDAITAALANRVAEADERLENATDQLTVSIAREQARYSRMDLERRRPKLYGPKQDVTVTQANVALSREQILRSISELERSLVVDTQQIPDPDSDDSVA